MAATASAITPYLVDGDGDMVSDDIDECPYTHPGVRVDSKGCPLRRDDGDLDGVTDDADDCPYTNAGAIVDSKGCALDSDFDGVANGIDRCPNTPLALPVNAMGCAEGERAGPALTPRVASAARPSTALGETPVVVLGPIGSRGSSTQPLVAEAPEMTLSFRHNSGRIGRGDLDAIQGYARVFARRLMADPAARVRVTAYADTRETESASLAVARMSIVRNAFLKQGIAPDRLLAENGVVSVGTAARNRRVVATLSH